MARIQDDIDQVRTAVFGKDTREAIADALENCYERAGLINVEGLNVIDDSTGLIITIANQ